MALRSPNGPHFLFRQSPQNISGDCIQTHEAGASVPSLSAMGEATFNTIMVAGCPAPLPPVFFKADHVSHASSPVGVSQTQLSEELVAWVQNLVAVPT
jgi:hypothetical protein